MKIKLKRKQLLSAILSTALLLTQLVPVTANQQLLPSSVSILSGEYNSITVTTTKQFIHALEQGIPTIIVNGLITVGTEAEASGRMLPLMIPGGITIEGTAGSCINCRCPIQIEGDEVTFRNIELLFESTDALGSIPHREIFLAGHKLTLDNVSTYLEGGAGAFGPLSGYETELLPSVFAGGYQNTSIGSNAELIVVNSNSKTIFQDIYMGHEEGMDQNVPYTKTATLTLDAPVTVRGGIYTDKNRSAEIFLNGESIFSSIKVTDFIGADTTTLTLTKCSVSGASVDGVGTIILKENAYLMPQTKQFHNITLQKSSCLDLSEVVNATITGDFEGEEYDFYDDSKSAIGNLVLDKEGTLTIEGTITGTTIFQTENKNFPGIPVVGKSYIIAENDAFEEEHFIIPDKYIEDGYKIQYNAGAWSIFKSYEEEEFFVPSIGEVEIIYAPSTIDLAKIRTTDIGYSIPDESVFCKMVWKDKDGNSISFRDIKEYYGFETENVLFIKTEYLEDPAFELSNKWGNAVLLTAFEEYPDYYYFAANETAKTGEYTIRFYSVETGIKGESTIKEVKELDPFIIKELPIYFYDSSEPEEQTMVIGEQAQIQSISDQVYTGKTICPKVEVICSSGEVLVENKDYLVSYENNINVGEAIAKVVGIGNYSGEITQTFSIVKSESDVSLTVTMNTGTGTDTNPVLATYGDKIRFVCQANPVYTKMARTARPNTVDFYCDKVLLGTASVDAKGQAVFVYNTTEQKIPIGKSTIYADFGGTMALNPAESSSNVSITLAKQTLAIEDIKSIALKDFPYDGTRKTAKMISLTLENNQTLLASGKGNQILFVSGEAELASAKSGTYEEAKILSWELNEEDSRWYQLPETMKSFPVDPKVTIIPAKAPEQVTIYSYTAPGSEQTVSILDVVPTELQNEKITYQLGTEQFGSSIVSPPSITDGILTYQAAQVGTETIPILVTLENYQPMTVLVTIIVTDKTKVEVGLTSLDCVYNGEPYKGWETMLQKEIPVTVTYYDLAEQQFLTEAPTNVGSYSVTVHMETDTEIGEETSNFQIKPKEIRIHPLDKTIQIGEEIPDFNNPQLTIDYEFESGYAPVEGEDLGTVKILYKDVPDNKKEGSYEIFIRLLGDHTNYNIIENQGTLFIKGSEEHIHDYIEIITKESTCTESGIKTYTCSECKDFYTEEIPASGHMIETIPAKEATCTELGKTEGTYCTICHTILIEQTDIPKKEHSYGNWIIDIDSTTTSEGSKHRICSLCNNIETIAIPKVEDSDKKPEETESTPEESKKPEETESTPEESEKPEETESTPEESEKPEETESTPEESEKPEETESTPEESEKPEETETTPEEGNNKPNDSDSDDDDDDFDTDDKSATTQISEKAPITTNKEDYRDPVKGYTSFTQGIITGNGNGYAKWKQTNDMWWLEYADGTWPYGQRTSDGQQIYKWEKINGAWYAFNADGYAENGWHMDYGYQGWFYIDINSGMKVGWQLIEGKWYYLNPISDGTKGKMFADCYTPDGWYVEKSGAWDGKPQRESKK